MQASLPALCRDPASARAVSFRDPFSFWAVSGGILAPRVPAPDRGSESHWPAGLGRPWVVAPGSGALAPCCGLRVWGRLGPSASCALRFLSPRFLGRGRTRPIRVWLPCGRCVPSWPPGHRPRPSRIPALRPFGGGSPGPETRPASLGTRSTSSEQTQRVCAPTAWARGHSPRRIGAPLGSPAPPPSPAEAWLPRLGLRWGWSRVGGAEWGAGSRPSSRLPLCSTDPTAGGGDQRVPRGGTGGALPGGTTRAHSPRKG